MKTYAQRQQATPKTIQSKASNQASAEEVLQSYKKKIVQMQSMYEDEPLQGKFNDTAQREELDEEVLLQGKFDTAQREEIDEDELLQGKFEDSSTVQKVEISPMGGEEANNTGMPDNLKNGIESLSGYSMDDVHVHYNSPKPAQLQALAYAQGTDIHIAPGQEQHLPHEAWHVVQQMQGRVQPTMQMQGIDVNDNEGLEKEADVMGGEAVQMKSDNFKISKGVPNPIIQGKFGGELEGLNIENIESQILEKCNVVPVRLKTLLQELQKLQEENNIYNSIEEIATALKFKLRASPIELASFGNETEFNLDKLRDCITPLYGPEKGKRPTRIQIINTIRGLYTEDKIKEIVNLPEFVYGLQDLINSFQDKYFKHKTLIHQVQDVIINSPSSLPIHKFTVRHYTSGGTPKVKPSFTTIESSLALNINKTSMDTGGHTNDIDWNKFGNVGNTFYLLCIDGEIVQKQKFLNNTNWYVEFPLDSIADMWLSSDWLNENGIEGEAMRGSGVQVYKRLLFNAKATKATKANELIESLGNSYNNLEVKIPGCMKFNKDDWKQSNLEKILK